MKYKIAVFPGDGVGPELIKEGVKVISKAAELDKFEIEYVNYPYGAEHYDETKEILSERILKNIKDSCSAIYCGTFDNSSNGFIPVSKTIRDYFEQSISLMPIKLLPTIESPLSNKAGKEIDFTIIRESSEEFFSGSSGRAKNGKSMQQLEINKSDFKSRLGLDIKAKGDVSCQIGVLSRNGCDKAVKYCFEYAKSHNKKKIISVDKSNTLQFHDLWRESFSRISKDYSGIEHEFKLIDAVVMNIVRQPEKFEVLAAPNIFGEILSDLGAAIQGISYAARGNINPDGISMFEPVHGCATKLKDKGIVNPIATIYAGSLMLDAIGQQKSGDLIIKSINSVLTDGRARTQDLDGNNTTSDMGDAILDKFIELHD